VAVFVGLALAAQGGCTRTDDGSVTMADPLHVGRYLQREPSPPATPPVQSGLQVFPVSPATRPAVSSRSAPGRSQRRVSAPAAPSERSLACRDAVTSGGRVHVICE
jgi:hypothetical protein